MNDTLTLERALRAALPHIYHPEALRIAHAALSATQPAKDAPYAETWFAVLDTLDQLYGRQWRKRCETLHDSLLTTVKAQAAQGEPAEHWHRLYLEKCQQYNDRVAQLGAEIEGLEAEAAQGTGEVVAWLHQCRKKPELKALSFRKEERGLSSMGYKPRPLTYADTPPPAQPAPVVPDGWRPVQTTVTEEMHVAAVRVLLRATGLDGLPQRILDALLSATPSPPAQAAADARDAFEAEMRCEETWGHRSLKKRLNGQYENWQVDLMWGVWKAALATYQQRSAYPTKPAQEPATYDTLEFPLTGDASDGCGEGPAGEAEGEA